MPRRVPHDASGNPHQPELRGPAPVAQWMGLLLSPAVFAIHFQLNYLLVLWVCGNDVTSLPIHVASLVALVLSLVGVWVASLAWRRAGDAPGDGDGAFPRTRLVGALGMGLGSILSLILLVQLISGFIPPLCQ